MTNGSSFAAGTIPAPVVADLARIASGVDMSQVMNDVPTAFAGVDRTAIASLSEALRGIDTKAIIDFEALRPAMPTFDLGATIAPMLAATFAQVDLTKVVGATFAETHRRVVESMRPFTFAKTLEPIDLDAIAPVVNETVASMRVPNAVATALMDAAQSAAATHAVPPAQVIETIAEDAIVIAVEDDAAESLDVSLVARVRAMTRADREELALRILTLIAAFLFLAAYTAKPPSDAGPSDPRAAGYSIAVAVALIRVYRFVARDPQ